MTARTPRRRELIELLGPVVEAAGYDLEDLSVAQAGRRSLIRVTVDADGGIDLDEVAEISRSLSEALDADPSSGPDFATPYVLEVSSPGVDRPLTEARHWRRAVGRMVMVADGEHPLTGRVRAVDEAAVVLDVGGVERRLALAGLGAGRVQVEFARPGSDAEDSDDEHSDADADGADEAFGDDEEEA